MGSSCQFLCMKSNAFVLMWISLPTAVSVTIIERFEQAVMNYREYVLLSKQQLFYILGWIAYKQLYFYVMNEEWTQPEHQQSHLCVGVIKGGKISPYCQYNCSNPYFTSLHLRVQIVWQTPHPLLNILIIILWSVWSCISGQIYASS